MRIKQAVILAGGKGTRLLPITRTTPKPMIPFYGKPFLEYVLENLRENGITDIVLLVGYLHEVIERYFGDGKRLGVAITYSDAGPDADTGTRIRSALPHLKKYFLLMYGDNLWPLDMRELESFYRSSSVPATVTVYGNTDNATKNNMYVNSGGIVESYDRSRTQPGLNGVDIGYFILDKNVLTGFPADDFSFEEVIIPRLIGERKLAGFVTPHKYYGLSTPDRIPVIQKYLQPKKVLFVDRDGVINRKMEKARYVTSWEEFEFLPGVLDAFALLEKKGYDVYVITNQPGVAQGMVTMEAIDVIHRNMADKIRKHGGEIAGVYVCPHGWNEGCFCRKPNPGMLFRASREHAINLRETICIGDDARDIMAGKHAAVKTIYIGNAAPHDFSPDQKPDAVYPSLIDAVKKL